MKLKEAVSLLRENGVDSPAHDAAELFMRIGKMSRADLTPEAECGCEELREAVLRRAKREPLQYIIGEVGFYRELYAVGEGCLIPRPDTEILVDFAVSHIPRGERFLDLCTGSGCVAISTLKNTRDTSALAVDISEAALAAAKLNAEKNGVSDRIDFSLADAREPIGEGEFFAVLSNPPYVTEAEYSSLAPELYFEPKLALVGGDGGLEFYKIITNIYKNRINPFGFILFLLRL